MRLRILDESKSRMWEQTHQHLNDSDDKLLLVLIYKQKMFTELLYIEISTH